MTQDSITMDLNVVAGNLSGFAAAAAGGNELVSAMAQLTQVVGGGIGAIDTFALVAGGAIAAFGVKAAQAFGDYEQGLKTAQIISGQTSSAISVLGQQAEEMSIKFRVGINDVTDGLVTLGRAGLTDVNNQLSVLEAGMSTAKISGDNLAETLNTLIQMTSVFGGQTTDIGSSNFGEFNNKMSDLMNATANSAPLTFSDVAAAAKFSGGSFAAAGANFDDEEKLTDYMASIAAFARKGVAGSMAGTALRAFATKPASQEKGVKEALAEIGLKPEYLWEDDQSSMKSISSQIGLINDAMEKTGKSNMDKIELWSKIVGGKMGQQMLKLDADEIRDVKRDIKETASTTDMATATFNTFNQKIGEAQQAGDALWRNFGEHSAQALDLPLTLLTKLMEMLNNPVGDFALMTGILAVGRRAFTSIKPLISSLVASIREAKEQMDKKGLQEDLINAKLGEGVKLEEDKTKAVEKRKRLKEEELGIDNLQSNPITGFEKQSFRMTSDMRHAELLNYILRQTQQNNIKEGLDPYNFNLERRSKNKFNGNDFFVDQMLYYGFAKEVEDEYTGRTSIELTDRFPYGYGAINSRGRSHLFEVPGLDQAATQALGLAGYSEEDITKVKNDPKAREFLDDVFNLNENTVSMSPSGVVTAPMPITSLDDQTKKKIDKFIGESVYDKFDTPPDMGEFIDTQTNGSQQSNEKAATSRDAVKKADEKAKEAANQAAEAAEKAKTEVKKIEKNIENGSQNKSSKVGNKINDVEEDVEKEVQKLKDKDTYTPPSSFGKYDQNLLNEIDKTRDVSTPNIPISSYTPAIPPLNLGKKSSFDGSNKKTLPPESFYPPNDDFDILSSKEIDALYKESNPPEEDFAKIEAQLKKEEDEINKMLAGVNTKSSTPKPSSSSSSCIDAYKKEADKSKNLLGKAEDIAKSGSQSTTSDLKDIEKVSDKIGDKTKDKKEIPSAPSGNFNRHSPALLNELNRNRDFTSSEMNIHVYVDGRDVSSDLNKAQQNIKEAKELVDKNNKGLQSDKTPESKNYKSIDSSIGSNSQHEFKDNSQHQINSNANETASFYNSIYSNSKYDLFDQGDSHEKSVDNKKDSPKIKDDSFVIPSGKMTPFYFEYTSPIGDDIERENKEELSIRQKMNKKLNEAWKFMSDPTKKTVARNKEFFGKSEGGIKNFFKNGIKGFASMLFDPFMIAMEVPMAIMEYWGSLQEKYNEKLEGFKTNLSESNESFEKFGEEFLKKEKLEGKTQDEKNQAIMKAYSSIDKKTDIDKLSPELDGLRTSLAKIHANTSGMARLQEDRLFGIDSLSSVLTDFTASFTGSNVARTGSYNDDPSSSFADSYSNFSKDNETVSSLPSDSLLGFIRDISFIQSQASKNMNVIDLDDDKIGSIINFKDSINDIQEFGEEGKLLKGLRDMDLDSLFISGYDGHSSTAKESYDAFGESKTLREIKNLNEYSTNLLGNNLKQFSSYFRTATKSMFSYNKDKRTIEKTKDFKNEVGLLAKTIGMTKVEAKLGAIITLMQDLRSIADNQVYPTLKDSLMTNIDHFALNKEHKDQTKANGGIQSDIDKYIRIISVNVGQQLKEDEFKYLANTFEELQHDDSGDYKIPTKGDTVTQQDIISGFDTILKSGWIDKKGNIIKDKAPDWAEELYSRFPAFYMDRNPALQDNPKYAEKLSKKAFAESKSVKDLMNYIDSYSEVIGETIETTWDKNVTEESSKKSGSGSGSKSNSDSNSYSGDKKRYVSLAICDKKEIPKLNVNLFKKPPSITVQNRNFKLRDIKINTQDKAKHVQSALKNAIIDVQKRSDPKIIQDEEGVYDPVGATDGDNLPSGAKTTR